MTGRKVPRRTCPDGSSGAFAGRDQAPELRIEKIDAIVFHQMVMPKRASSGTAIA